MSKHTPGPWEVKISNNHIVNADHGVLPFAIKSGYALIGALYENDEDARLIEAAPKLLESLEKLLERYVQLVNSGDAENLNPELEDEVIQARDAIARANGETK